MKITKLILKNFTSIYTGMGQKNIDIDLSKSSNRVVLLIGDNGSGKTSILSNMHPFAYPGNMDIRNGIDIILENHDGYKEIHIQNNDIIYKVKHFYSRTRDSLTVKSFISKNDTEINPNGNVTSFKEILEIELDLDLDFLKLLRLGSNVTSFIGMKSTDRKKFTSTLLADVDVYSAYYKKINDDSRLLKSMIKSLSDKLQRLGINDIEVSSIELLKIQKQLEKVKSVYHTNMIDIGRLGGLKDSLYSGSLDDLINEVKDIDKNINSSLSNILKGQNNLDRMGITCNILDYKSSIESKINSNNQSLITLTNKNTIMLDRLETLYIQRDKMNNEIELIDSENHIRSLLSMVDEINNEISSLYSNSKTFPLSDITKGECIILINNINSIQEICLDILSYNSKGEVEYFIKNKKSNIKKKIDIIDKSMLSINMQLNQDINEFGKNELRVLYQLCDKDECPYITYYNNTSGKVVTKKDELALRLSKLDNERTYLCNVLNIESLLGNIGYILSSNKELFNKLGFIKMDIDAVYKCILGNSVDLLSDMSTDILSYIYTIDNKIEIDKKISKIDEINKEIEIISRNSKSLELMKSNILDIVNEIDDTTKQIEDISNLSSDINEESDKCKYLMGDIMKYIQIESEILEHKEHVEELTESRLSKKSILEKLGGIDTEYKLLSKTIIDITKDIKYIENQIDVMKIKISEFSNITSELSKLSEAFDDITIIKESLSSNTGIPLLFVQLYLRNTRKTVNELLDTVYGGTLEVETFVINDKEFRIPYSKNGIVVDDVIYASQGEMSFISLVMSLALIKQSIKKYDILLLDEVDSTLDEKSRLLFLNILEIYLEDIGCEQVFMITHNNAFDNYDVDMIITSQDKNIDNYKKVNILYKR